MALYIRISTYFLLFSSFTVLASGESIAPIDYVKYDWSEVAHDLMHTEGLVEMRFTSEVQSYLDSYLVRNRSKSERIVSQMMLYFPLIEQMLLENDLPDELKYLAIVESALAPKARSRSGAVGLWQFMSPTARELGLRIYHSVDERSDPYRSTEAAIQYIKRLYDRFGDWELTLAAYNSGPNRVDRLMKLYGVTNYWQLRPYLPKETANYVPAYIAATYVFSDFNKHGLIPTRVHPDRHFTTKVEIYNHKVYLKDLAKVLHVDLDTLLSINPMYKRDYIPSSPHGYNLIIPYRCVPYFEALQDTLQQSEYVVVSALSADERFQPVLPDSLETAYTSIEYVIQDKENLFTVSQMFGYDVRQLKYWNNLPSLHVDHGGLIQMPLSLSQASFRMIDYKPVVHVDDIHSPSFRRLDYMNFVIRDLVDHAHQLLDMQIAQYQSEREAAQSIRLRSGIPASFFYSDKPLTSHESSLSTYLPGSALND